MTTAVRLVLFVIGASALLGSIIGMRNHTPPKAKDSGVPSGDADVSSTAHTQNASPEPATPGPAAISTEERFVEDIFLECGEDVGAAYYLSRVREVARDGNPEFARELFRQMKERHGSSPLVEEAGLLLENGS